MFVYISAFVSFLFAFMLQSTCGQQQQLQQQQLFYQHYKQHNNLQCPNGVPPHLRPVMDVSNKAQLAPLIAIARLEHVTLYTPSSTTNNNNRTFFRTQIDVTNNNNNNELSFLSSSSGTTLIKAQFVIKKFLKNGMPSQQNHHQQLQYQQTGAGNSYINGMPRQVYAPSAELSLYFKVYDDKDFVNSLQSSLQLPTTNNGKQTSSNISTRQANPSSLINKQLFYQQQHSNNFYHNHNQQQQQILPSLAELCALEIDSSEYKKNAKKLFKTSQDYILFLTTTATATSNTPVIPATTASASRYGEQLGLHAYALHELLTAKSGQAVRKVTCAGCCKYTPVLYY